MGRDTAPVKPMKRERFTTALTIAHHAMGESGEFVATVPGSPQTGRLTYVMRGPVLVAEHTLVPDAIGGRGVAGQLVLALIEHARANGLTIDPQCSYVAAAFRRHPEWGDLSSSLGD